MLGPRFRTLHSVFRTVLWRFWRAFSAAFLLLMLLYWLYGGFVMFFLLALALCGAFYHFQDAFVYYPHQPERSRLFVQTPTTFSLPYENIYLRTEDGIRINAYLIKQPGATLHTAPTILFLHGNAGNIGHRLPNAQALYVECGCNVLLLEYRGYGRSDGVPSENGLFLDAKAGMDLLLTRSDIDTRLIIIFGRSLGGAVAAKVVSHPAYMERIYAVIVENTFTSLPDMARVLFPPVFAKLPIWAFRNQYFTRSLICHFHAPTLFLSGLSDQLIPPWMMQDLFQNCGSHVKHIQRFPGGGHNTTWQCRGYYDVWRNFLRQVPALLPDRPRADVRLSIHMEETPPRPCSPSRSPRKLSPSIEPPLARQEQLYRSYWGTHKSHGIIVNDDVHPGNGKVEGMSLSSPRRNLTDVWHV